MTTKQRQLLSLMAQGHRWAAAVATTYQDIAAMVSTRIYLERMGWIRRDGAGEGCHVITDAGRAALARDLARGRPA